MTSLEKRKLLYWPWLALPVVLLSYVIFWNSLPERMGVHFSWTGKTDRGYVNGKRLFARILIRKRTK